MKTLEEVIKDRIIITSSLKELKLGETEISEENNFWLDSISFGRPFLKLENVFFENSVIVYRVLKPLIHYLFSSFMMSKNSRYATILLKNIYFEFCFRKKGSNTYSNSLFNVPFEYDEGATEEEKEKIKEINEKLLTSYDEETNKKDVLLTFNEPFNIKIKLKFSAFKLKKIINFGKIFKSDECIICLNDSPNVLFCECGHIPICGECCEMADLKNCPICQTKSVIKRTIE